MRRSGPSLHRRGGAITGARGARGARPTDAWAGQTVPGTAERGAVAAAMTDQTYCDRLVQDTPFLTGHGRLSEQQVDKIILQLNRYYPQILTNKEAEKFRNPRAALRVRLCNLLSHLQLSGERDCQEFYRALYIHAQPLHSCLPSRHALQNSDGTELDSGVERWELSDRDSKVLPGARRVLGFSPVIIERHISRYLLTFLAEDLRGP
ncbi:caspase recruitment domain-containing protein 19 isoform 3-T3 [Trichechus inunguis]